MVRALVVLGCVAAPVFAQVVMNEVLIRPGEGGHRWVEVHNKGEGAVSLEGWKLANRGGRAGGRVADLGGVIEAGGYVVIHLAAGEARPGHIYVPIADLVTEAADELALYSTEGMVDFVAWFSSGSPYRPGPAHNEAVQARMWPENQALNLDLLSNGAHEVIRFVEPGTTLGRDGSSTDTNGPGDFDALGGRHAGVVTEGGRNLVNPAALFVEGAAAATAAKGAVRRAERARWTVLYYMNGDNDLGHWWRRSVSEVQDAGGSTGEVNHVVQIDFSAAEKAEEGFDFRPARGRIAGGEPGSAKLQLEPLAGQSIFLPEANMASAATLREFVEWGAANYPAERYILVIGAHGDSWKGLGPDASAKVGFRDDFLYMNELSAALAGQTFEVVVFQACLMAGLEVAYQIRGSAKYMVASEEVSRALDGPWSDLTKKLRDEPDVASGALAVWLVETMGKRIESRSPVDHRLAHTWSAIDLGKIGAVAGNLDTWSKELWTALPVHQKRGEPSDNVQVRISERAAQALRFYDVNYVDLYDLAEQIGSDPAIPACAKQSIPFLEEAIRQAVVANVRGPLAARARGMHIHFPLYRSRRVEVQSLSTGRLVLADPYDHPSFVRATDAASPKAAYHENQKKLPLKARDQEDDSIALAAPREWPTPAAPDLKLSLDTAWARFLDRYYHPVAEAWIVDGMVGSLRILPETIGANSCLNGYDRIKGPVGMRVALSARGSSDVDGKTTSVAPYLHDWDLDLLKDCSMPPCYQPTTVPALADAAREATDNVDQDNYPENSTWDDRDAQGSDATFVCAAPGAYSVRVVSWDDDHTYFFHDTLPSAEYVHPQTDAHYAVIECVDTSATAGGTYASSGGYPYMQQGDLVVGDHAVRFPTQTRNTAQRTAGGNEVTSSNVRGFEPHYPISVSGVNVVQLEANGVRIADGGTAVVLTDAKGVLRTRHVGGPAGAGSLRLQAAGLGGISIPLTTVARIAPLPEEVTVTAPGGPFVVGRDYAVIVEGRRGGQPVPDLVATFFTANPNLEFRSGSPFRNNTATQARTGATGRVQAMFRPTANGPALIEITAGGMYRTFAYTATGGTAGTPTAIEVLSAPASALAGQAAEIVFRVVAVTEPVANTAVTVTAGPGSVSAPSFSLTTNAAGEARFRFTAARPTPLTIGVAAGTLRISVNVPVFE